MKEHPLLLNDEMVCVVPAGTKTQTRRPVKGLPPQVTDIKPYCTGTEWPLAGYWRDKRGCWNSTPPLKSPFGVPGDVLWVRECHAFIDEPDSYDLHGLTVVDSPCDFQERVCVFRENWFKGMEEFTDEEYGPPSNGWRPSIHMPKWACRTRLAVKRVWVERVQEISEEDAKAEGIAEVDAGYRWNCRVNGFVDFWDSLYPGSWARNDWVWACKFEKARAEK